MPGRMARALRGFATLACLFLPGGCLPGSTAPPNVQYYALDYPAPAPSGARLDAAIKIERFSVAQAYNSSAMIYRPKAYRLAAYNYHRWRNNPADLTTDCLIRDFRSSGSFRAVFSYSEGENARFRINGAVEDFLESREGNEWKAILGLSATLVDQGAPGAASKVVFQKQYRAVEPIADRSPEAFASMMSKAMARLSAQIIGDVAKATDERPGPTHRSLP